MKQDLYARACEETTLTDNPHITDYKQEWAAPLLFESEEIPTIDTSLLPDNIGAFIDALSHATETPKEMAFSCVMSVLSTTLAGKYVITPKEGWHEHLNSYWFTELPPASRKSCVVKACTAPLTQWERLQNADFEKESKILKSQLDSQKARVRSLREIAAKDKDDSKRENLFNEIADIEANLPEMPVRTQLFTNNVTPESLENLIHEQGGTVGVISDEGGVMETLTGLYSKGKANVDILLKGIDGGDMRVKRKDRDYTLAPLLSICLCVQPVIRERMSDNEALQGNGALERFIYLLPRNMIGNRTLNTLPVPESIKAPYNALITTLLDIEMQYDENGKRLCRTLTLSNAARAALHEFGLWLEPQMKPHAALYFMQGWAGKSVGFTARIAGLLHIADGNDEKTLVSEITITNAIAIMKILMLHAKKAFGAMGRDTKTSDAIKLHDWLMYNAEKHVSRGKITTGLRHTMKAAAIDAATDELVTRNIVRTDKIQGKSPKPTIQYTLNPALFAL